MLLYLKGIGWHKWSYTFCWCDEYNTPANNSIFTGVDVELKKFYIQENCQVQAILQGTSLCSAQQGCGRLDDDNMIISKYLLTGITPAFHAEISPLAEAIMVSDEPKLYGICGFTESEVKTTIQHYLNKDEHEADP